MNSIEIPYFLGNPRIKLVIHIADLGKIRSSPSGVLISFEIRTEIV